MSAQSPSSAIRSGTALYSVLWPHKESMTQRWVDIVHGTYPFNTVGFLHTQKNRFANPVGYRTEEAARALIHVVFNDKPDEDIVSKAVEEIVRVRAIQDFSPEAAVGVFFALKDIVRNIVADSGQSEACHIALLELESRIDAVVLLAFGFYARCREKVYQLKIDEFKRRHSQVFRLAQRKAANEDEADTPNP